jgi:hypothetical protein
MYPLLSRLVALYALVVFLVNKVLFRQMVVYKDFPVPRTYVADTRADLEAISSLRHSDPLECPTRLSWRYGLFLRESGDAMSQELDFILYEKSSIVLTVSEELLSQLMCHSVQPYTSDQKTIRARISQVAKTLHTVNRDRSDFLFKQLVTQNTTLVAEMIFLCARTRVHASGFLNVQVNW